MDLMRKIIDETFCFQLGFALSSGFMGIQEVTDANLRGHNSVLMMQFLLGSLSPGRGLHGARNFKPHYLLFSENPQQLHHSFAGRRQSPG